MEVFISWSGNKSRDVALLLRQFLKDVLHPINPWMSEIDIDAGSRWSRKISEQLENTKFGILCLTRENQKSSWLLFEAGALAKSSESDVNVCPYLIDLEATDILKGPLSQFQSKKANKKGTWELIIKINKLMGKFALSESNLKRIFNKWWPDYESSLKKIQNKYNENQPPETRTDRDIIEEILELTRLLEIRTKDLNKKDYKTTTIDKKIYSHPKTMRSGDLIDSGNLDEFINEFRT